jgi:hypothetical protein
MWSFMRLERSRDNVLQKAIAPKFYGSAQRGHKRAILAVAHQLLIAVYHMLTQHQPYRDYQATPMGQQLQQQRLKQLQKGLKLWATKFNSSLFQPLI